MGWFNHHLDDLKSLGSLFWERIHIHFTKAFLKMMIFLFPFGWDMLASFPGGLRLRFRERMSGGQEMEQPGFEDDNDDLSAKPPPEIRP